MLIFFPPMPPHVHTDFVVPPPGCGRSVTERGLPGGALKLKKLNSTSYPYHGPYGNFPLQGKIPTAEPGIETGTSVLEVRSADHEAMRLVC
jgi:hypothetical protein